MKIDPKLVKDLYGKYAPDQELSDKRMQAINAKYGENHHAFLQDFYAKYAPNQELNASRVNAIFNKYNLKKKSTDAPVGGAPSSSASFASGTPSPEYQGPSITQQGLAQNDAASSSQFTEDNTAGFVEHLWKPAKEVVTRNVPQGLAATGAAVQQGRADRYMDKVAELQELGDDEWITIPAHPKKAGGPRRMKVSEARTYYLDNAVKALEVRDKSLAEAVKFARQHNPNEKQLIQSLSQVNNEEDMLKFIFGAVSQSVAQIPLSIGTFGSSSFVQEFGQVYTESILRIAEKEGISPQEVMDKGLDDPVTSTYASGLSAALDYVGAKGVVGQMPKELIRKTLRSMASRKLAGMGFEGVTEGTQSTITQIGEDIAADDPIDVSGQQVLDEAAAGFFGATVFPSMSRRDIDEITIKAPKGDLGKLTAAEIQKSVELEADKIDNEIDEIEGGFFAQAQEAANDPAVQQADEIVDEQTAATDEDITNLIINEQGQKPVKSEKEQKQVKKEQSKLKDEKAKLTDKKQNLKKSDKVTKAEEERIDERIEEINEELTDQQQDDGTTATPIEATETETAVTEEIQTKPTEEAQEVKVEEAPKTEVKTPQVKPKTKRQKARQKAKPKTKVQPKIKQDEKVQQESKVTEEVKPQSKDQGRKKEVEEIKIAEPSIPKPKKQKATPKPKAKEDVAAEVFTEEKMTAPDKDFDATINENYEAERNALVEEYKDLTGSTKTRKLQDRSGEPRQVKSLTVPQLRKLVAEEKESIEAANRQARTPRSKFQEAQEFYKESNNTKELGVLNEADKILSEVEAIEENNTIDPQRAIEVQKQLSKLRDKTKEATTLGAITNVEKALENVTDKKAVQEVQRTKQKEKSAKKRAKVKLEKAIESAASSIIRTRTKEVVKAKERVRKKTGTSLQPDQALKLANASEAVQKFQESFDKAVADYKDAGYTLTAKEKENLEVFGKLVSPEQEVASMLDNLDDSEAYNFSYSDEENAGIALTTSAVIYGNKNPRKISTTSEAFNNPYGDLFRKVVNSVNKLRAELNLPAIEVYSAPKLTAITKEGKRELGGIRIESKGRSIIVLSENMTNEQTAPTALHEANHSAAFMLYHIAANSGVPQLEAIADRISKNIFNKAVTGVFKATQGLVEKIDTGNKKFNSTEKALISYIGQRIGSSNLMSIREEIGDILSDIDLFKSTFYGLSDAHEMVAESFSSPGFAALMDSIEGTSRGLRKTKSLFRELIDTLKTLAKKFVDTFISNKESVEFSLLDELTTSLDNLYDYATTVKRDVTQNTQIVNDVISNKSTLFAKKERMSISRKAANKVINKALDKNIDSEQRFEAYVNSINANVQAAGGKALNSADISYMKKRFKTLTKEDRSIETLQKEAKSFTNTPLYQKNHVIRNAVDALLDADPSILSKTEKKGLTTHLSNLVNEGSLKGAGKFIAKLKAKDKLDLLAQIDPKEITNITKQLKGVLDPARALNVQQAGYYMSKSNLKTADKISRAIYTDVIKSVSDAKTRAQQIYHNELLEIIKKRRLRNENLVRVQFLSELKRMDGEASKLTENSPEYIAEVIRNANYIRQSLQNKIKAAIDGKAPGYVTEATARKELEIFESLIKQIDKKGLDVLTSSEKEFRDALLGVYARLKQEVQASSEIQWETSFPDINEYAATWAIGTLSENKSKMEKDTKSFEDIISNAYNPMQGMLSSVQAGQTKQKRGSKDAYYNYNAADVALAYLNQTLLDVHATPAIRTMNEVLVNNKGVVDETISEANRRTLTNILKSNLNQIYRPFHNYSGFVRFLENAKNDWMAATIGNITQVFVQLVGTLSGMAIVSSPQQVAKSMHILSNMEKNTGMTADEFFNKIGVSIQQRDALYERNEDVQALNRRLTATSDQKLEALYQEARNWGTKISSRPFLWADKTAARATFLSVFLDNGGNLTNLESQESLNAANIADMKTSLLQNTSNMDFAPAMFKPESQWGRIAITMMLTFKGFAWNQMINSWMSLQQSKSPEARKLLIANFSMALSYQLIQTYAITKLMSLAVQALGFEDDEEERKEERTYSDVEMVLHRAILDNFFGGLHTPLYTGLSVIKRDVIDAALYNTLKEDEEGRGFNPLKDSPTFAPYDDTSMFSNLSGGYGPFVDIMGGVVDLSQEAMSEDGLQSEDLLKYQIREMFLSGAALSALPLPKGDLIKFSRPILKALDKEVNKGGKIPATPRREGASQTRRQKRRQAKRQR